MADLVGRSLEVLRAELPRAFFRMSEEIGRRRVTLVVDGEEVHLAGEPFQVRRLTALADPDVQLWTSRQTILDIVDARLTLATALTSGHILLHAGPADLHACHRALLVYLQGAVRCPSFPALLEELRRDMEAHDSVEKLS